MSMETCYIGGNVADMGSTMIPMISDNMRRFLRDEKLLFVVNDGQMSQLTHS